MISDRELDRWIYALSKVVEEEGMPARKKKEMENIFDRVISKEILPRASEEQVRRFYRWFTAYYRNICSKSGEEPRSDLINEDEWLAYIEEGALPHGIVGFQMNDILEHMDKIKNEEELREYYKKLQDEIYPIATKTQIRKIMSKYDETLKRLERKKEFLERQRNLEILRNKLGIKKGQRVEMDGLKGVILDISTPKIFVQWDTGFKNWIDMRDVRLIEESPSGGSQ